MADGIKTLPATGPGGDTTIPVSTKDVTNVNSTPASAQAVERIIISKSTGADAVVDISPLTDTELRLTPVPVSGTVATGGLTDTQLRATPVPVSVSSSALPSGAATLAEQQTQSTSLSAIAASASVLDDWDESDRAKVNIVVGQAGVTAGAGAVAANTQRVTLASDDPAVAVLGATTGAAVITDANGAIQQYLRGLVKLWVTPGSLDVDVLTLPAQSIQPFYIASATITISPENVASSATFVAGVESTAISNISTRYNTAWISGKWTVGTTPTINTVCRIYVYAPISDDLASSVVYPDVLDGTSSAETFTSVGVMNGSIVQGAVLSVDATTSDRVYYCAPFSLKALLGYMPTRWGLYISHNSGVNTNTTASNHAWSYIGEYDKAA